MRENETYNFVLSMVRDKYKLDRLLLLDVPVWLTYDFPEWEKEPEGEEEYGSDSDRHLHLVVEVVPWRGSVRTTDVNVYDEQVLMENCTPEEMGKIGMASDAIARDLEVEKIPVQGCLSGSSEDPCSLVAMGDMPHAVEGMIRLAEVPDMVASEVQPGNGFDKGKGKMVDAGVLQDSQGARAYEGSSQLHGSWPSSTRLHEYKYEFVEISSEYAEELPITIAFLREVKGFASVFHDCIPSTKLIGKERNCVPVGSYELDTAALPQMIEDGEEEDW
ncbi:hypothetical protein Bca4012_045788 [Brassica carinata]